MSHIDYDVVVVGGGPAGLQSALTLGRGRKRVLLCDSGPPRNAAAVHVQNFVTRDGVPPAEFRRIAREQLQQYPKVQTTDARVDGIAGEHGAFEVRMATATVRTRRVLLCTGMIDELPEIDGFHALWGKAIFACPYCHGWEVQDRRWGYLPRVGDVSHLVPFALQARGWSGDVTVFTDGAFDVPPQTRATFAANGIRLETDAVARLVGREDRLEAIALADGRTVRCDVLFAHSPQRHVDLVRALNVALDDDGYVRVDLMRRETSVTGLYAAGDLTTRMQGAIHAAAAGTQAAATINVDLAMESAVSGIR
jgi:thioredoxin reductase